MRQSTTTTAEQIMTSPILTIAATDTLEAAIRSMEENDVSGLLVLDHREAVVGVISLSDIVSFLAGLDRARGEPGGFYRHGYPVFARRAQDWDAEWEEYEESPLRATLVEEIMSPEIVAVGPRTPLPEVARTMANWRIHRIFVGPAEMPEGIISSLDMLRAVGGVDETREAAPLRSSAIDRPEPGRRPRGSGMPFKR